MLEPSESGVDPVKTIASPRPQGIWSALVQRLATSLPRGSLRHSLALGAFWSLAGAVTSRGLVLVSSIVIARFLGKQGYGEWGLVTTTTSMFGQLAALGMAGTMTKFVAEFRESNPQRAGRTLSFLLVAAFVSTVGMGLVCVLAADLLADRLYHVPHLAMAMRVASLILVFTIGTRLLQGAMVGFEAFRQVAMMNAIEGTSLAVLLVPFTWRYGLIGTILAMSVSQGIVMIMCLKWVFARCREQCIPLGFRGLWEERAILWRHNIPDLLTSVMTGPAMALSQASVSRIPGGVEGLGGYQAAVRWSSVVNFIPQTVSRVTLPMLSRIRGERDRRRFVRALWANLGINAGLALLGALPLIILSPWIMGFYGEAFRKDWDVLVILLLAAVLQAVMEVVSQLTRCLDSRWYHVATTASWAAFLLIGCATLVGHYGVRGYVWAGAMAMLVNTLMYCAVAPRIIRRAFEDSEGSMSEAVPAEEACVAGARSPLDPVD